jgi:hypothetical protein
MFIGCNYTVPARQNLPGQSGGEVVNEAFEIEIEIPADDLVFPLYGLTSNLTFYDYQVDWGDSTSDTYVANRSASHTYSAAGTYKVSVTGDWPGARFSVSQNKLNRVTKLLNWGRTGITDLANWFEGSTALVEVNCKDTLQWNATASTGSMYRAFYSCSNLTSVFLAGVETDIRPGVYTRECFMYGRNIETFTVNNFHLDTSVSSNSAYRFCYSVGTLTTDGCEFNLNDWSAVQPTNTSLSIHQIFSLCRIKSVNANNWDLSAISNGTINMSYFTASTAWPTANKTAYFKNWKWHPNSQVRVDYFNNAAFTEEIDFSGNSDRMNICYAYQMGYGSRLQRIKGLNKFKMCPTVVLTGAQRIFRRAQYMTFSPTDPSYNFSDDFLTGSNADSLYLAFENCGNAAAVAGIDSIPNIGNWDTSNIVSLKSAFSGAKFSDYPVLNWDLSNCTSFFTAWQNGEPKGTNYTKDLDLRNVTFLPNSSSSSMDWYFTFAGAYFANIYFPDNQDFARTSKWLRTFRYLSNTNMEETHMDTWDYSNIGTGSEDLYMMQANDHALSATFYGTLLARIRATAPTTVNSKFQYNGTRIDGGALYTSQQVGTFVNGSTVINVTGIGVGVSVGDILYQINSSQTARYYYRITAVNSNDEIEIASGLVYTGSYWNILTSQAVKDRQYIVENLAISFTDGKPILT